MTVEFKGEEINEYEKRNRMVYVGYISPSGQQLSYNNKFGGNWHDAWQNPASWTFLKFVSYILKDTNVKKFADRMGDIGAIILENNSYEGLEEFVIRGYDEFNYYINYKDFDQFIDKLNKEIQKTYLYSSDEYHKLQYEILKFFRKAYSNKTFFETIGRKIYVEDKGVIDKTNERRWARKLDYTEKEKLYLEYLRSELMKYFKDICVQYLGYDSVERFDIYGREINVLDEIKPFYETPRVITTSYQNVNERYFNYLLMNWRVDKLPRYLFNEQIKCFESDRIFNEYESEKENTLGKEIESIKRLVKKEDRYKYFR